jgi:hypothetical protein
MNTCVGGGDKVYTSLLSAQAESNLPNTVSFPFRPIYSRRKCDTQWLFNKEERNKDTRFYFECFMNEGLFCDRRMLKRKGI